MLRDFIKSEVNFKNILYVYGNQVQYTGIQDILHYPGLKECIPEQMTFRNPIFRPSSLVFLFTI